MASLKEKQKYYEYGLEGWDYKQPPSLDPALLKELDRVGRGQFRLLWAGIALVRPSAQHPYPTIRGNADATKIIQFKDDLGRPCSQLIPRYPAGGRIYSRRWHYKDKDGHAVRAARADEVPEGVLADLEADYVQYGVLRWYLERYLTADQLVETGRYTKNSPHIPPKGDYIFQLKVQTPDELYYEPDSGWLQAIAEHLSDEDTYSLHDLYLRDKEAREKREQNREAMEDAAMMNVVVGMLQSMGINPNAPVQF